jgi:hypothetical protein
VLVPPYVAGLVPRSRRAAAVRKRQRSFQYLLGHTPAPDQTLNDSRHDCVRLASLMAKSSNMRSGLATPCVPMRNGITSSVKRRPGSRSGPAGREVAKPGATSSGFVHRIAVTSCYVEAKTARWDLMIGVISGMISKRILLGLVGGRRPRYRSWWSTPALGTQWRRQSPPAPPYLTPQLTPDRSRHGQATRRMVLVECLDQVLHHG